MAWVFVGISGDAIDGLKALAARTGSARDVLDDIGAFLDSDVQLRFLQEQAPDGTRWEQSEAAKERASLKPKGSKKPGVGLTLTDTRQLASSVTHSATDDELIHGMGEKYAAIHHFGGKTGRNKSVTLPARPILGIALMQREEIDNIVKDWLV